VKIGVYNNEPGRKRSISITLAIEGREVLYLKGYGHIDSSCCGTGGCSYALVKGFILDWKIKKDSDGFSVSLIEPIREVSFQKQIKELIYRRETVQQISFEV